MMFAVADRQAFYHFHPFCDGDGCRITELENSACTFVTLR